MDSMVKIYLGRSFNELSQAKLLFAVSNNNEKKEEFQIEEKMTFYSGVISHSYYSIFFSAKALLLTKGIKTAAPEVHKKTYEEFKENFIDSGIIDVELLKIYKNMIGKADELLQIFKDEKWKGGYYTYKTIPQANKEPAEQSLNNSTRFIRDIKAIIEK